MNFTVNRYSNASQRRIGPVGLGFALIAFITSRPAVAETPAFDRLITERAIAAIIIDDIGPLWRASGWRALFDDPRTSDRLKGLLKDIAAVDGLLFPDGGMKRQRALSAFSCPMAVAVCFDSNRPGRRQIACFARIADPASYAEWVETMKSAFSVERAQYENEELFRFAIDAGRRLQLEWTRVHPDVVLIAAEIGGEPTRAGDVAYSLMRGGSLAANPYYADIIKRLNGRGGALLYYGIPAHIASVRMDLLDAARRASEIDGAAEMRELNVLDQRAKDSGLAAVRGAAIQYAAADGKLTADAVCVVPNALDFINRHIATGAEIQPLVAPVPDFDAIVRGIDALDSARIRYRIDRKERQAVRRQANLGALLDAVEAIEAQRNSDAFLVQSSALPAQLCEVGFFPEADAGRDWRLIMLVGARIRKPPEGVEPVDLKNQPVAYWQPPEDERDAAETTALFGDRSIRVMSWTALNEGLPGDRVERLELSPTAFRVLTDVLKIGPALTVQERDRRRQEDAKRTATPLTLATTFFGMQTPDALAREPYEYLMTRWIQSLRDCFISERIRLAARDYLGGDCLLTAQGDEIRSRSAAPFFTIHPFAAEFSRWSVLTIEGIVSTHTEDTGK